LVQADWRARFAPARARFLAGAKMPKRKTSAEVAALGAGPNPDTPTAQAIRDELAALNNSINYASVQSHLYADVPESRLPRPPVGIALPWGSNLRHIAVVGVHRRLQEPLKNQLGKPIALPEPSLALTARGCEIPESSRAIMARGGASTRDALTVREDAELAAYEASKGTLAERASQQKGSAAEIMSRDVRCCPLGIAPLFRARTYPLPFLPLTPAQTVDVMLKLTAEKPINTVYRETFRPPAH